MFQTHDNREHIAMMEKILSKPMPGWMVRKTRTSYFDSHTGRLKWDPTAPEARYTNQHCKPLNQYGRQKHQQSSLKNSANQNNNSNTPQMAR